MVAQVVRKDHEEEVAEVDVEEAVGKVLDNRLGPDQHQPTISVLLV